MDDAYSLIIPVLHYEENAHLPNILSALDRQSHPPAAVHLVIGDKRQGRAINFGVEQAETGIIGTVDDDTEIDDSELFRKLVDALLGDDSIGIAGAACDIPEHATSFQKRAMRQIPRRFFPVQTETIDSDMVQHPCLIMRRDFFKEIGGEDEELIRGLDPVLRHKVRQAGKRVVIVAETWVYHLIPDGLNRVMSMYYRNGRGSGYASRHFPERVLELSNGYDSGEFEERRPLPFRVIRRFGGLASALVTLKWIKLATDLAYITGVMCERLLGSSESVVPAVASVRSEKQDGRGYELHLHFVELDSP